MHDLTHVHALDGQTDLGEPQLDLVLAEVLSVSAELVHELHALVHLGLQRATVGELHANVQLTMIILGRLARVYELNNVGMPQHFHNVHLKDGVLEQLLVVVRR